MKKIWMLFSVALLLAACGETYEETKQRTRAERIRLAKEDSAALKIAVMPTLDCLPLYVAKELGLFDTARADIRLKPFTAQMDCDTALLGTSAEGMVTDLVRAERIAGSGVQLRYVAATPAQWLLISNRNARLREPRQLEDKMVGMARYSATDLLTQLVVDSAKIKSEYVFRIQVNDINVRLQMLQNSMIDAVWLTEPQATVARLSKHRTMQDSRRLGMQLGVLAFREDRLQGQARKAQMDVLIRGYNQACDTINKYGVARYRELIARYCGVKPEVADSMPTDIRFQHTAAPRQADVERARTWNAEHGERSVSRGK